MPVQNPVLNLRVWGGSASEDAGASSPEKGWASMLARDALTSNMTSVGFSRNRFHRDGEWGQTSTQLAGVISREAQRRQREGVTECLIAIVQTCGNDGERDLSKPGYPQTVKPERSVRNLRKIIQSLKAAGYHSVIVQGLPPVNERVWLNNRGKKRSNLEIQTLNAQLKRVSSEEGAYFLDVYEDFSKNSGDALLIQDGLHPNDWGHLRIYAMYKRTIAKVLARFLLGERALAPV